MFREKSERFIFTKAGESLTADTVLAYLGKSIPVCPYSGDTINVVKFPVDFNAQNVLPSNMEHVSKTLLKRGDGDMIMASIEQGPFTITLYVPTFVLEKNIEAIKYLFFNVYNDQDKELVEKNPVEAVYAMWDALMFNSVKGIFEVKLLSNGVYYFAEAQLALGKLASKIKDRESLGAATKLHLK